MVSLRTIATIGVLIAGAAIFVGAGGARGVGTRIGSAIGTGFKDFSTSISQAFTGGLFPSAAGEVESTGMIGPAPRTGTEEFDPFGNLAGNLKGLQNILDSINNAVAGAIPGAFGQTQPSVTVGPTPSLAEIQALSPSQVSGLEFAIQQDILTRGGTSQAFTVSSSGSEADPQFTDTFQGKTRIFGSSESLNKFLARTGRL